jgi:hypothetical protein
MSTELKDKKYSNPALGFLPENWVEIEAGWNNQVALCSLRPGVADFGEKYGKSIGIYIDLSFINPDVSEVPASKIPFFSIARGENMSKFLLNEAGKTLTFTDQAVVSPSCNFSAKLYPLLEMAATRLGKLDFLKSALRTGNFGLIQFKAMIETSTQVDEKTGKKKTYIDKKDGKEKDSYVIGIKEIMEFVTPMNMPGMPMSTPQAPAMQPMSNVPPMATMPQAPQAPVNPGAPKEKTLLANFLKSQGKVSPMPEADCRNTIMNGFSMLISQGADLNSVSQALQGQRSDILVITNGLVTF